MLRVLDSLKILLQQPKAAHRVHALFDHESFTLTCYISELIYGKPLRGQKYLHFFYMPPFSLNNPKQESWGPPRRWWVRRCIKITGKYFLKNAYTHCMGMGESEVEGKSRKRSMQLVKLPLAAYS